MQVWELQSTCSLKHANGQRSAGDPEETAQDLWHRILAEDIPKGMNERLQALSQATRGLQTSDVRRLLLGRISGDFRMRGTDQIKSSTQHRKIDRNHASRARAVLLSNSR